MKISIITVVFNSKDSILDCITSVLSQTYKNVEYIIIDGDSSDGTMDIINKYKEKISKIISEPDHGIYDAMNKGVKFSTGEVIGILNSDDFYADNKVIEDVVNKLREKEVDSCYGDLVYVNEFNTSKVVRYWKSGNYYKERFEKGWMPPHPTFFVKRYVYEKCGNFDISYPIGADYELMLRFLYKYNITSFYIPRIMVKMRTGGSSSPGLFNTIRAGKENYRALVKNGFNKPILAVLLKSLSKIQQFFHGK